MNKEVVSYNIALALQELNFNESCFGFYYSDGKKFKRTTKVKNSMGIAKASVSTYVMFTAAPLYQQIFRWFREKHGLVSYINRDGGYWIITIEDISQEDQEGTKQVYGKLFPKDSYRKAEDFSILRMIELVKR